MVGNLKDLRLVEVTMPSLRIKKGNGINGFVPIAAAYLKKLKWTEDDEISLRVFEDTLVMEKV